MPLTTDAIDVTSGDETVLSRSALRLVERLHRRFEPKRQELLAARGEPPGFRADTRSIRESSWQVAPAPDALQDRRVEITGPVERKMMINALNSGAKVFMADFEDSHSPTWHGTLDGVVNIRDAVAGTLRLDTGDKQYEVGDDPAQLVVRVRGLHLPEPHLRVEGTPVSAGLFDAAMVLHHVGDRMFEQGIGPFLYIPKIESMEEAAWWDEVLGAIETEVGLPQGSTKVTVLIETLPAAFQMDEILHAMKDRIVALNAGRWDYIFSCIKTFRDDPDRILPDRAQVTMTVPFMRAYTERLVATCHRRGAHAMGGMSAFIPDKRNEERNRKALDAVRADKLREAEDGFDGTWVAHPGLVDVAREPFDDVLGDRPNQLGKQRDVDVSEADLLDFSIDGGQRTMDGLRLNIDVGLRYIAAWLTGRGAVAIHGLMEDAATAEISRSQVWQWRRHGVALEGGARVTDELIEGLVAQAAQQLIEETGEEDAVERAADIFGASAANDDFPAFLTLPALDHLLAREASA